VSAEQSLLRNASGDAKPGGTVSSSSAESGRYPFARKNFFGRGATSVVVPICSGAVQRPGQSLPRRTRPAATGFARTYADLLTTSSGETSATAL
jgi:hypothetical protein